MKTFRNGRSAVKLQTACITESLYRDE